jgi:hypothetical protein
MGKFLAAATTTAISLAAVGGGTGLIVAIDTVTASAAPSVSASQCTAIDNRKDAYIRDRNDLEFLKNNPYIDALGENHEISFLERIVLAYDNYRIDSLTSDYNNDNCALTTTPTPTAS